MAALGSPVRRAVAPRYSSRTSGPLRRRLVVGLLVLASLAMITVYFRESPNGGLHGFQSAGVERAPPLRDRRDRIARPFEDAYDWTADVFHAKRENEKLRQEVKRPAPAGDPDRERDRGAQRAPQPPQVQARARLRGLREHRVTARSSRTRSSQFDQTMVIAAGRTSGIRVYDAVVTDRGLVGQVTKVAPRHGQGHPPHRQGERGHREGPPSGAIGIVRHSQGSEDVLFLDRVAKNKDVKEGDLVVTAGKQSGRSCRRSTRRGFRSASSRRSARPTSTRSRTSR